MPRGEMRIISDSRALRKAFLTGNKSFSDVAKELNISAANFSRYLNYDCGLQYKTAQKLIRYFGEDIVYLRNSDGTKEKI